MPIITSHSDSAYYWVTACIVSSSEIKIYDSMFHSTTYRTKKQIVLIMCTNAHQVNLQIGMTQFLLIVVFIQLPLPQSCVMGMTLHGSNMISHTDYECICCIASRRSGLSNRKDEYLLQMSSSVCC